MSPLVLLYVLFMVWLVPWGRRVHGQAQPLRTHGLGVSARHQRELAIGETYSTLDAALWAGKVLVETQHNYS